MNRTLASVIGVLVFIGAICCLTLPVTMLVRDKLDKRWRRVVVAVGTIVTISACLAVNYFLLREISRSAARIRPFELHLGEYVGIISNPEAGAFATGRSHARGKAIIIEISDSGETSLSGLSFRLPDNIRATTAEEVGTVASISCKKVKIGSYGGLGGAYVIECNLKVFDKTSRQLIYQQLCTGGNPPQKSLNGSDQEGSFPQDQLINAIASLYK